MPFAFRTALRTLARDRGYAFLGGLSLAIALVCCLLVGMFVRGERSVDTFHPEGDRLHAVWANMNWSISAEPSLSTPMPLAAALEAYSVVEAAAVSANAGVQRARAGGGEEAHDLQADIVSENYLDLFGFRMVRGDRATALRQPGVVLTERAARRLFGDADPVGQPVTLERWRDTVQVAVTGVLADSSGRTQIADDIEAMLSITAIPEDNRGSWRSTGPSTFLRLAPGRTEGDLAEAFEGIAAEFYPDVETAPEYGVVPVSDLHLSELSPAVGFRGSSTFLRLFVAIAIFVLLLGVINYINLATARATRRAGEVGVRKAIGAQRGQVALQFLIEAVVLSALAALAALVGAVALRPAFNALFGADLAVGDLDAPFVLGALGLALATGVLAGAYPALVLSGFRPVEALRGAIGAGGASKGRLRQSLVVVQLVVAIALLSGSGVVLRQLAFAQNEDPGYDADGLVVVETGRATPQWRPLVDAIERAPGVQQASPTIGYPSQANMFMGNEVDGRDLMLRTVEGEPDYLTVLGARPVAGRLYDDRASDRTEAVVLNEAAVRELGWGTPAEVVGRSLEFNGPPRTIIGVIADQHMTSFHDPIDAMQVGIRQPYGDEPVRYSEFLVRLRPGQLAEGVAGIRAALAELGDGGEVEVTFLDEKVAALYASERRLSGVLGAFSGVAILLACLGLFGLAAYAAERRTKEIGVRRVLGASIRQIVVLLTREYAALVGIGAVIAVPLAIVGLQRWLDSFAYRVELGPGVFAGVVALLLVIALGVVSGQAIRAARRDPAAALRTD